MSHLSGTEQQRLAVIANEVREAVSERGYRVGRAVELDKAFLNSQVPGASLMRELVKEAAERGAGKAGLHAIHVAGGGLDIPAQDGNTVRWFRLKKATRLPDETYELIVNGDSTLFNFEGGWFRDERWVLGYTLNTHFQVEDIFAAEVLSIEGSRPGKMLLGEVFPLGGSAIATPSGFVSTDEGLDGFDDEDECGEVGSQDAG